jgi:hypothetical protein
MKKVMLPIAAIALVGLYASSASAQCEFNALAKTKGIKGSMIRAFAGCPSTEYPTINTSTGAGGTPACTSMDGVVPAGGSTYVFGEKGSCSVDIKAKVEKDCSQLEDASGTVIGLPPGACHVTYVKGNCKGIMQADTFTPINANDDAGWSLATLSRATVNDADNGDMTIIDFPVTFLFGDPKNGGIKVDSSSAEALASIVGPSGAALPPCTQIEVLKITLKDPNGDPFAVLGGGTK